MPIPAWAQEMRDLFRSGSTAQFILHGNINDVIPVVPAAGANGTRQLSIQQFLDEVMFEKYDIVLHYDRGHGIRPTKGLRDYADWLETVGGNDAKLLATERDPARALELLDQYLLRCLNLKSVPNAQGPTRIAIVISFAEFVVPRGEALQLGGGYSQNVVKTLAWANDPAIQQANIATVLIVEQLHDLNDLITENPHASKLKVPLPDEAEMLQYMQALQAGPFPELPEKCEVPLDTLARRLTGLSRVGARTLVAMSLKNGRTITARFLSDMKKQIIERECQGLLEFVESPFTLDMVSGMDEVKKWLREDTTLLKKGSLRTLPMGYLIAGRIGTGKTFLVNCWAGELGIPCVVFKNFRDKWVGATESNLDKIFSVLRALGQVVVFVDEADQMTGKRESSDSDSGLSGRVYGMLAKEMSETRNRGRIIWVFATSRPDLVEVDLKRQGRLDVHIPLFPPQTQDEYASLFRAIAGKLKFPLDEQDLPLIPQGVELGGNEVEGVLVRALRQYELEDGKAPLKDLLAKVIEDIRPSPHARKLQYMDLIAVKECTDSRFLPEKYRAIPADEIDREIARLRPYV